MLSQLCSAVGHMLLGFVYHIAGNSVCVSCSFSRGIISNLHSFRILQAVLLVPARA